jgi:hypothetical protein
MDHVQCLKISQHSLGCPKIHQSSLMGALTNTWLTLYNRRSTQKKIKSFNAYFLGSHHFLHKQRKFRKIQRKIWHRSIFCSHFFQEGRINLIPLSVWCICIAVSGETHIEGILGHISIWLYGHIAKIWSYSHMAI